MNTQDTETNTSDTEKTENLYSTLSKENLDRLEALSKTVINKELKDLTFDEAELLIISDIFFLPSEVTVSAGATRRLADYESANYHLSEKIDLSPIVSFIKQKMKDYIGSMNDLMTMYTRAKATLFLSIEKKMISHENYLRQTMRQMEISDGVLPRGRFKESN